MDTKSKSLELTKKICGLERNSNGIFTFIEIKENNKYYSIICGNFLNVYDNYFKLMKINIENEMINLISSSTEEIQVSENFDYQGCYAIKDGKIICFIYIGNIKAYIFNYQLEKEKIKDLSIPNLIKCIHIKNNIGSIIYLTVEDSNNYLNIEFLDYQGEDFANFLPSAKYQINYNKFNYNTNSFIKISDNKICFIAQTTNIINIYLIYLYEQEASDSNKVVIREYNIIINSLYNVNYINNDNNGKISSIIYNNFIALGLNYVVQDELVIQGGLIIFGYANSTDYELDLEEYIANKNNLDVEIYLKTFLKIENNVFGYEYCGSIIIDLVNCNSFQFYSSKNTNKEIEIDSKLEIDETIKFDLELKDYNPIECIIEYRNIVSKPDLEIFNNYPNNIQSSGSETYFSSQKGEYIGKQSSYIIKVNNELKTTCDEGFYFVKQLEKKNAFIIILKMKI